MIEELVGSRINLHENTHLLVALKLGVATAQEKDATKSKPVSGKVVLTDRFSLELGLDDWHLTQPDRWKITDTESDQGAALHLLGKSGAYEPPHRSPHSNRAVERPGIRQLHPDRESENATEFPGHRDMCIFWGWQDPAHFYYVHLGEKPDPNSSQIFIVNEAPRTPITRENAGRNSLEG